MQSSLKWPAAPPALMAWLPNLSEKKKFLGTEKRIAGIFFFVSAQKFFFRQKLDESKFWFRLVKMVGPRIIFLWLPVLLFRCWNWVVTSLSLFPTREDWAAHHHAHSPSPILSLSHSLSLSLSPYLSLSLLRSQKLAAGIERSRASTISRLRRNRDSPKTSKEKVSQSFKAKKTSTNVNKVT